MYQLESPIYFYLLAVIPVMITGFLWLQWWKKRAQSKFASPSMLAVLTPEKSTFKEVLKFSFFLLAFLFLTFALVNPKIGSQLETVKREGVDIVFAVDVSKSMLAEDIAPNRIDKSKRLVSETINQLRSDRIGIIAYAAKAIPQLPITTDFGAAKMFLQGLNTNMLSSQGTAIEEAIGLANGYFDDKNQTNRVLCIVSDGEDHGTGALAVAEKALELGITIFAIGVGTEKGGPIPIKKRGVVESYKKDDQGEVVITRLQAETLKELANATDGLYVSGEDTQQAVELIIERLQQMDKQEFEAKQFVSYKDQFQWFLGVALFLIFLDLFLFRRKTKWIQNLNLFNEGKK
ncbi:MAG: VWA domain-containing protein [Flavobacteriaceae bacterium]|nr:VWA domain-containing protein [Flavobacteriaceae bacterium]MDG2314635.1 VWA domain-containing protein [Flavobacteriaceae bacterium]